MFFKKSTPLNAQFKTSVAKSPFPSIKNLQGQELPEIAVVGRSNVGKSSLLNDLFLSKNLVKTSSTPGKTQLINFFTLNDQLCFVDLPGYGFAKVPIEIRKQWGPMIQDYLNHRKTLHLILFLFDIRRVPNEEDIELMRWIAYAQKNVILILTKIDKVTVNQKNSQTNTILKTFGMKDLAYLHYSIPQKTGRVSLMNLLNEVLK